MPIFKPMSDLSMVVKPSSINFGHEWSARLEPYCENFAEGTTFTCSVCDKDWPGASFECPACQQPCCRGCLPPDTDGCKPCLLIKEELLKVVEKDAPKDAPQPEGDKA